MNEELVLWGFILGSAPPYNIWLMIYIKRLLDEKNVSDTKKLGMRN